MAIFSSRSLDSWIKEYASAHQNKINIACHLVGIPLILIAGILLLLSYFAAGLLTISFLLFVLGWILQFVGHAFEGKPPEFFKDWRFLFVGVRWWLHKVRLLSKL